MPPYQWDGRSLTPHALGQWISSVETAQADLAKRLEVLERLKARAEKWLPYVLICLLLLAQRGPEETLKVLLKLIL